MSNNGLVVFNGKCFGHRHRPPIAPPKSSSPPHGGGKSNCGVPKIGMVKKNICIRSKMVVDYTILHGEILIHVFSFKR